MTLSQREWASFKLDLWAEQSDKIAVAVCRDLKWFHELLSGRQKRQVNHHYVMKSVGLQFVCFPTRRHCWTWESGAPSGVPSHICLFCPPWWVWHRWVTHKTRIIRSIFSYKIKKYETHPQSVTNGDNCWGFHFLPHVVFCWEYSLWRDCTLLEVSPVLGSVLFPAH